MEILIYYLETLIIKLLQCDKSCRVVGVFIFQCQISILNKMSLLEDTGQNNVKVDESMPFSTNIANAVTLENHVVILV